MRLLEGKVPNIIKYFQRNYPYALWKNGKKNTRNKIKKERRLNCFISKFYLRIILTKINQQSLVCILKLFSKMTNKFRLYSTILLGLFNFFGSVFNQIINKFRHEILLYFRYLMLIFYAKHTLIQITTRESSKLSVVNERSCSNYPETS